MSAPALLHAGHMLSWPAQRYPNRVALSYQGHDMTFREVDERVNRLANALIGLGLRRGDRVAALLANSPRAIETRFALMKAGLCMVALNVRQAPQEHAYILAHSEAKLLVVDAEYLPIWEQIGPQCGNIRQVIVAAPQSQGHLAYEAVIATAAAVAPEVMVAPDELERLAYTSGTTGLPKGIMKTIGNDLARMRNDFMNEERPTTAEDVMLNVAPLTHAARVFARKHYLKGARNIILRRFEVEEVLSTIQRQRVTTAMFVPTMLVRLVRHPHVRDYDTSSLQRVFFGTAPLPADTFRQAIETFGNIFQQNYGLSEATQPVLSLTPADLVPDGQSLQTHRLACAGRPVNGVEVRIINQRGEDVSPDEAGELVIRGDIVMAGYWKDPQATRDVLDPDGWLHTGDVARRDPDGYISIVDRQKDMIISGGFNVYPREVERVIENHSGVQEVAVIGVPDAVWGEVVTAVVVPRPGTRLRAEEIIERCKTHIASYKSPKAVHVVDDLPKSFQGKILKRVLRDRYGRQEPTTNSSTP